MPSQSVVPTDMKRSIQKQRSKLFRWTEAYAIFSVGVPICLMGMVGEHCRGQIALSTTADSKSLEETISSVLGSSFLSTLAPVNIDLTTTTTGGTV